MKENHHQTLIDKPQPGYLIRAGKDNNQVNESQTNLSLEKYRYLHMSKDTDLLSRKRKLSQDI